MAAPPARDTVGWTSGRVRGNTNGGGSGAGSISRDLHIDPAETGAHGVTEELAGPRATESMLNANPQAGLYAQRYPG